jgi:hypothetical protein
VLGLQYFDKQQRQAQEVGVIIKDNITRLCDVLALKHPEVVVQSIAHRAEVEGVMQVQVKLVAQPCRDQQMCCSSKHM